MAADGALPSLRTGSPCPSSNSPAAGAPGGKGAPRGATRGPVQVTDRGSGGRAPPPLDTRRDRETRFSTPAEGEAQASPGYRQGQRGEFRHPKKYAPRHKVARPSRASLFQWKAKVADELDAMGRPRQASAIRGCGSQCFTSDCGACSTKNASVRLSLHCDLRVCPFCQRQVSGERTRLIVGAALRVSGYVATQAPDVIVRLKGEVEAAREMAAKYLAHGAAALARGDEALAVRHQERFHAAEGRRSQAQWHLSRAGEHRSWRWTLLTISPRWNPTDPDELTVEGLTRRILDVWDRWHRVWSQCLAAGGLAGATARLEISTAGHVHLHAMVFGGFVRAEKLQLVAGCFVDRRAPKVRQGESAERVMEKFVREAVKYAVKATSSTRWGFVSGEESRSGASMSPVLAARVTVALESMQTIRHYGPMLDAVGAERAMEPTPSDEPGDDLADQRAPRCPCCGADALLPVQIRRTVDVARELRAVGWQWGSRPSSAVERLAGAGERLPPRVGFFRRVG